MTEPLKSYREREIAQSKRETLQAKLDGPERASKYDFSQLTPEHDAKVIERAKQKTIREQALAKVMDDRRVKDPESGLQTPEGALKYMNDRYAWIESIGRIALLGDSDEIVYQRTDAFRVTHGNAKVKFRSDSGDDEKRIDRARFWLTHPKRRSYSEVGLWPPPAKAPERALNLWQGFAVERAPGDWHLMAEHIETIIAGGDPKLADYVINWSAWLVQNPGERAEVALALRGLEGSGKGIFGHSLKAIVGSHAVQVTDPKLFATGRFNGHLDRCVFLFADECHWPGNKQYEGQLKGMLTEPTRMIERKGIDAYAATNMLHVLISSNDAWVVPAGVGARRFVVCDVSDARKGDFAYFAALGRELENGGLAAMLHALLEVDLRGWHPRQIVETEALRDQKERSLTPEDEWLLGLLEDGVLPGRAAKGCAYSAELAIDARDSVPALRNHSMKRLGRALKVIGCEAWLDPKSRQRGWQFPPLADVRATWDAKHGQRTWDETVTSWR